MLSHREHDKARHYLDLLDVARCNGHWQEIPELTRKVWKHAPHRQCLTLTAQIERTVAEQASRRPVTSSSATGLSQSIPSLVHAIEKEEIYKEDAFQARVCLAWLYSTISEHAQALSSLPAGLDQVSERLAKDGGITSRWTHVCIMKGAYIKGFSLETEGKSRDASRTYESMLPYISKLSSTFADTPEHKYWTENLLSRYCMLSGRHVTAHNGRPRDLVAPASSISPASILAPFRMYAKNWDARNGGRAGSGTRNSSSLRTWQAYYDALSVTIQNGIVQPMFVTKLEQSVELKKVETTYESILMKEVKFPRADQANAQIESWVDQVMANWRTMCGSTWQEEDLRGGRLALGRSVLDILYRAATRTFHSTQVLRHLFTVHAALADFYLASKALDSYFQILTKGKARFEKSGEPEIGLDDDATALGTAAAGIKMLCHYGRRKEAEMALVVATTTENRLCKLHPSSLPWPVINGEDATADLGEQLRTTRPPALNKALALGYHALGVSQSCWALLTHDTSSRSDLQAKAKANFHAALQPELGEEYNIEILYSLAHLLAETRDLDPAIAAVKRALSSSSVNPSINGVSRADFAPDTIDDDESLDPDRRGLMLRCWHLLALLLSARQNFATAIASCEAALDLYGGKSILFGDTTPLDSLGLLRFSEKKNIIEIKMTQLALSEVLDGPEEAVNAGGELLGLYTNFFKYAEEPPPKVQQPSETSPPSANGTLRSLRGSILGLPNPGLKSRKAELRGQDTASSSLRSCESPDEANRPPIISVTGDDGAVAQNTNHHSHFLGRHESKKLHKRNSRKSMGSRRISRAASPLRPSTSDGPRHHNLTLGLPSRSRHNESTTDGSGDSSYANSTQYASDEVGVAISHDLPSMPSTPAATSDTPNPLHTMPPATQNMNHRNPNTYPVSPKPPPSQTTRSPPISPSTFVPLPEPHYPPSEETRHALTLLTKIWLLISSLYRRASMPADAQGALSEATKHVQTIETAIAARDGSSAASFTTPGYSGLKSSGELWADVLAEQAALHVQTEKLDQASQAYETALGHHPTHVAATVGLCNILLDAYAKPLPVTKPNPTTLPPNAPPPPKPTLASLPEPPSHPASSYPPPADLLSRLAARDRAYGLLSALTKSGQGWDCSEAWFALARAYEEGGQVERAKEALWWVVELEGGRPVRGWGCVGL